MSEVCERLHLLFNSFSAHRFPFDRDAIPRNGIYILFENGELAHGGNRIVRVGTHNGANQLGSRLRQHFVNENKDRSIFRKNIGRALLHKANDPFLEQWEWDLTSRKAKEFYLPLLDKNKQRTVEREVSEYIQRNLSFVIFPEEGKEERLAWEQKIISTLSWCEECNRSQDWLGRYSPKQKIRESGLWLVNGLYKEPLFDNELKIIEKKLMQESRRATDTDS